MTTKPPHPALPQLLLRGRKLPEEGRDGALARLLLPPLPRHPKPAILGQATAQTLPREAKPQRKNKYRG